MANQGSNSNEEHNNRNHYRNTNHPSFVRQSFGKHRICLEFEIEFREETNDFERLPFSTKRNDKQKGLINLEDDFILLLNTIQIYISKSFELIRAATCFSGKIKTDFPPCLPFSIASKCSRALRNSA